MRELVDVAKALSDPGRIRILLALKERELCVCQLTELLGLAPSTVSKHMAVLRQARLVDSRRDGRWAHYRRSGPDAPLPSRNALEWLDGSVEGTAAGRRDGDRMRQILTIPVEELCQRRS